MKTKNPLFILLAVLLPFVAGLALFTGCATTDKLYDKQVITTPGVAMATNVVTVTNYTVVTHDVTNVVATREIALQLAGNDPAAKVQEILTPKIEVVYGPSTITTNLVPRPIIETVISGAGALPVPFAGTAALALGWLYSAYAAFRNKKTAKALVTGIEAGRRILNETDEGKSLDAQFRSALVEHQELAGVLNEVGKLVNQYTGNTTGK